MTRRKQNCPKRMKWEGEGEAPPDGPEEEGSQSGDEEGSIASGSTAASPPPLEPAIIETDPPLNSEMSPGHDSRESSTVRSPSRDSVGSERATPMPAVSPMALLPPTVYPQPPPLHPHHHHHHHRMMTSSPQGSVSPLISSSSPPILVPANPLMASMSTPEHGEARSPEPPTAVLDFSTKRASSESPVLNLSKTGGTPPPPPSLHPPEIPLNSPLDLSVTHRKRSIDETSLSSLSPTSQPKKSSRPSDYKPPVVSPWTSPVVASHFPYFAAAVAAANSLSPKSNSQTDVWNGKMKEKQMGGIQPSDASRALEKMSELSKLGGDEYRPTSGSGGNRHSAWQSHWLNKGAEQAKDVLKCVWCKQSFPSLAAMTTHMKEAKHCGVNLPSPIIPPPPPPVPSHHPPVSSPSTMSGLSSSGKSGGSQSDLNLLIKETMPLPRKLVRGQDVWLGKGAEQTRQILKCMWCGQSFRSLAEMTSHMQQTQHYTNIISQEQIISWKSAEEGKPSSNASASGPQSTASSNVVSGSGSGGGGGGGGGGGAGSASSHVSAVLTCKVCDQAFSSLKELSNHMVKNSHYKEHIMRSITEGGGRRRQTREKRKKSLPVRKLLELERAQNELKNGEGILLMGKHGRDMHSAGRITCEKCKEKIDMAVFVDHIRLCVGNDHKNLLKSALMSSGMMPEHHGGSPGMKEEKRRGSPLPTDLSVTPSSPKDGKTEKGSSPSVLNAIEKLIEKSFDSRARHGAGGFVGPGGAPSQAPIGSSILKRLGIDESVDYTKPLIDAQTMNLLRSYHHQTSAQYRRERSGSESSSISERGRSETMTPDRKYEQDRYTPRTTPEKRAMTPPSNKSEEGEDVMVKRESSDDESKREEVRVKKEVDDFTTATTIKQEMENGEEEEDRRSYHSDEPPHKRLCSEEEARSVEEEGRRSRRASASPAPSPATSLRPPSREHLTSPNSPASSDRSGTPRSASEKKSSGSLGALSSMFDNLSGASQQGEQSGSGSGGSGGGAKGASHPLAALQKLCDKTETHTPRSTPNAVHPTSSGSSSSTSAPSSGGTAPGAILAFSWACNDAVVTADSIMKCAFCDTPFISKGAYRHHLSKMHFVKDGVIPDPVALKAPSSASPTTPSSSSSSSIPKNSNNNNNNNNNGPSTSSSSSGAIKSPQPAGGSPFEESPHSKFLKYTELAKQLSSKYV